MTKINIQFTRFSAFYSPLISTMSGGFLKEEGLEPSHSIAPAGKSAIEGDDAMTQAGAAVAVMRVAAELQEFLQGFTLEPLDGTMPSPSMNARQRVWSATA